MAKGQRFTGTTRKFCSLGRRSVGPACKVSDFIPRDYLLCKLPVTKLTAVRTPREIIASVEDQLPPATGGSVESQLLNGLCSFHVGFPEMRHQLQSSLQDCANMGHTRAVHNCTQTRFVCLERPVAATNLLSAISRQPTGDSAVSSNRRTQLLATWRRQEINESESIGRKASGAGNVGQRPQAHHSLLCRGA